VRRRLESWINRQLNIQARLGIGQLALMVSSDVIESLMGKLKVILARNPKAEFNHIVLASPCLCGSPTGDDISRGLRTVTHRHLEQWTRENVPATQRRARLAFNRGELTPDTVPKTAQGQ